MKYIILRALFILLVSTASQAATIGFNSTNSVAHLNDTFTVDIVGGDNFPETQGGGVNLFYDPSIINVLSVSIDNVVWNFFTDEGGINNVIGEVNEILVSAFSIGSDPSGNFIVAAVEFQAVGIGFSSLSLTESIINPWAADGSLVNPDFLAGSVTVSQVPVPGILWLIGAGSVPLVLVRRIKFSHRR